MSKIALASLAAIAALYVIAVCVLFVSQRSLVYPAPRSAPLPAAAPPGFSEAWLETADSLRLRALFRPARTGRATLVFFHGNGDSLAGSALATRMLAAAGYGLLFPEYRGYGDNPGAPSEAGLYRDGRAALAWLQAHGVALDDVILVGNSLGSGIATQLATEQRVGGLVIISGFTSLPDVAAQHLPVFPVRLLLRDRYDNHAKLAQVQAPVLVLHGTADTLIPSHHANLLAKAARRGTLELVPGAGHELAYLLESQAAILRWCEQVRIGNN